MEGAAAVSPPVLPGHIWHHRLHTALGENLCFYRLAFSPVYLRDSASAGIKTAFATHEVKSAAVYELFGPFDLLLRVWLPKECPPAHLSQSLEAELKPHGLDMLDSFAVDYVARHWAFAKKKSSGEPSEQAVVELLRDTDKIRKLENNALGWKEAEELKGANLLALPEFKKPAAPGIKFALAVSGNSYSVKSNGTRGGLGVPTLTKGDREDLEKLVTSVVADAKSIADRSLYAGEGFGHFLILGRVAYKNFHDIHAKLVTQLGSAPIRERFGVSTVTLVSGQRGMQLFQDSLVDCHFLPRTPLAGNRPAEAIDELRVGALVAERFEVIDRLGDGGFGVVYHVVDHREGGVERALKLFPSSNSDAAQREVAMLRKVKSPYVVEMFWGERDPETGWWYLVSEFVNGDTLASYIRGDKAGTLSDLRAVDVIRQVLLGLEAVHPDDRRKTELAELSDKRGLTEAEWEELLEINDSGMVHRDVTPANIMVTGRYVKLIDFNISSLAGEEKGTDARTPRYSPPGGWSDRVWEPRVDLFATGVILYELLCSGEHPYPDGRKEMVSPKEHRDDLTTEQLEVMRRACSVESCFVGAREMRDALERAWGPVDPLS